MSRTERIVMLISTMDDVPGYTVACVPGEVFGLTVRPRHVGSRFGAVFKSRRAASARG
jgi:uncharacterized protein YbjQ (UPF0145 family)